MKTIATREITLLGRKRKTFKVELPGTGWMVSGVLSKDDGDRILTGLLERQEHFNQTRRYLRGKSTSWALYYANGWQYDIVHDDNTNRKRGNYVVGKKEMLANARLIAAAPELLNALKKMVELHAGQEHLYGLTDSGKKLYKACDATAASAIAKAKGKTP